MVLTRHIRAYAALDFIAGRFVPTAAHSTDSTKDDPLDLMGFKIRFSNSVLTTKGSYDDPLNVILNPSSVVPSDSREVFTRLSPAFAWVNFEKDIFCIENLGHRFGGRFRFLSHNIGAKVPKPLAADHWASRIQTLTLQTSCESQRSPDIPTLNCLPYNTVRYKGMRLPVSIVNYHLDPAPIVDSDVQALEVMSSLKRVLLVLRSFTLCELLCHLVVEGDISRGYVDYGFIRAIHKPGHVLCDGGVRCNGGCCPAEISHSEVLSDMRQKLDGIGKKGVELKLVADTSNIMHGEIRYLTGFEDEWSY
ncbi:hypothetical protein PG999_012264 [Apiospora kogelbergensis]|uniref:Uncharacterized protein n=1 Tax=Apiospora kogelbergensis TaxID=1337665 RepID=A0AAW0QFH4_9PEZI